MPGSSTGDLEGPRNLRGGPRTFDNPICRLGVTSRMPTAGHRGTAPPRLGAVLTRLEQHFGSPEPFDLVGPFEMVLWENVAYLASDPRRSDAFARLRKLVGTRPEDILGAPTRQLESIGSAGILPRVSARKMVSAATIAQEMFGGDLSAALHGTAEEGTKALRRFPGIGVPAAEKILLFTRSHPILALDSNGLRVLCRLGYTESQRSYAATYRAAQRAGNRQLGSDYDTLIKAYHLLRRHGQELCKRSRPSCPVCPIRAGCRYARAGAALKNAPQRAHSR